MDRSLLGSSTLLACCSSRSAATQSASGSTWMRVTTTRMRPPATAASAPAVLATMPDQQQQQQTAATPGWVSLVPLLRPPPPPPLVCVWSCPSATSTAPRRYCGPRRCWRTVGPRRCGWPQCTTQPGSSEVWMAALYFSAREFRGVDGHALCASQRGRFDIGRSGQPRTYRYRTSSRPVVVLRSDFPLSSARCQEHLLTRA